ncbi:head maturation protease, ClpP-related [Camelimonas lactis]|uniref:ATP-dependent protease ClpP protease subunit n=1 Tax=Camelimonas lactis TaxID=659006 RepID=A0A4R2GR89_9HYPH|nr:head maturation protease, ClpP-related [Camelimonas lactis]TCO12359.1 ATP-dependent protease ClpP protease subunit [Camelimonas lactis]
MSVLINGDITLYGMVGADFDDFSDDYFTARQVVEALAGLGNRRATVRINSGGGSAFDGLAIYNSLKAHKGGVDVVIDGIAASAASVIAMAGDSITMREGALLMIHEPATWSVGNAADLKRGADFLDMLGDKMAGIYSARTGNGVSEMRDAMRAETWMDGAIAVAMGFATSTEDAEALTVTAFDYRLYQNAPDTLKALASANAWGRQPTPVAVMPPVVAAPEPDPTAGWKIAIADVNAAAGLGERRASADPGWSKVIAEVNERVSPAKGSWAAALAVTAQPEGRPVMRSTGSWATAVAEANKHAGFAVPDPVQAAALPEPPDPNGWRKIVADLNRANGF